ncbi:hypothetical protein Ccrd_020779, partial [Cynara cardunculus var. scolymus]
MLQIEYEAQISAIEQKIKLLESFETVTNIPVDESLKTKAIPEQTAYGKESTNSLKANALLKSINKDNTSPDHMLGKTSRLVNSNPSAEGLSKMTTLSSNKMQEQKLAPSYLRALKDNSQTRYYVNYRGPHKGVYTDWGVVEAFCKEGKTTAREEHDDVIDDVSLLSSAMAREERDDVIDDVSLLSSAMLFLNQNLTQFLNQNLTQFL